MRQSPRTQGGTIPPGSPDMPNRVISPSAGRAQSPSAGRSANLQVEHENIWPRPASGSGGRPSIAEGSASNLMAIQEGARGGSRGGSRGGGLDLDTSSAVLNPSAIVDGVGECSFSDLEEEEDFFDEEEDEEEEGSMMDDASSLIEDVESMYMPSALSNVCEGAYLKVAQTLLDKKAADRLKANKKKSSAKKPVKKSKSINEAVETVEPSCTPQQTALEGFEVFKSIMDDLVENKYLEKTFVDELNDSLAIMKRELPILPPSELETKLTRYCMSVCNHVMTHAPHLLVSQNKHSNFRKVMFHMLSLIGIIYECCHLTNDDCIVGFMPNPGIVKFMEEVALDVIGCIVGGSPETVESEVALAVAAELEDLTNKSPAKKHKDKKGSKKKKNKKGNKGVIDDGRCSADPLHPRLIHKCADIAISDREFSLKAAGFQPSLEALRKWTREINHGKMKDSMDESWFNCSKLHCPDDTHPMTSEERHLMCAFQVS
jgi:hypothetical protein